MISNLDPGLDVAHERKDVFLAAERDGYLIVLDTSGQVLGGSLKHFLNLADSRVAGGDDPIQPDALEGGFDPPRASELTFPPRAALCQAASPSPSRTYNSWP